MNVGVIVCSAATDCGVEPGELTVPPLSFYSTLHFHLFVLLSFCLFVFLSFCFLVFLSFFCPFSDFDVLKLCLGSSPCLQNVSSLVGQASPVKGRRSHV